MLRKNCFCMFFCLMFMAATNTFAAQSEIFAKFYLPENVRTLNQTAWNKKYKQMLENLPDDKFAPGRILFKIKGSPGVFLWTFDPKTDIAQMLAYLKSLPNIEYCQPDYIYTLKPYDITPLSKTANTVQIQNTNELYLSRPNDPWYSRQAHLKFAGMENLFQKYGPGLERLIPKGHNPYIHIVDSGGGCEHPDLNRANIILKKDFVDGDDDPCSSPNGMNHHGEFVATIACATSNNNHGGSGVCPPNTKLLIWRVLDKDGRAFSSTIALALADIVIESAGLGNEIVNMSFGGPREDPFQKFFILTGSAPQESGGKNIIFVGASGNDGDQTPNYPVALNEVISVGASEFPMTETGEISRASYSSYGKVDIMAPAGGLDQDNDKNGTADAIFVEGRAYDENGKNPTPYGAYLFWGTSGAAPIVSAVAASLVNMGIYGPVAIRKVLTETAGDIPPLGYDQETGWGMVRADVAVMSVDDSFPVFGSFSQNSSICTTSPDENTCSVSVIYKVRPNGRNVYLYDTYSAGTLRDLGESESSNSVDITVGLSEKTWVLLLYYPGGGISDGGNPQVFASTFLTAKTAPPPTGLLSSDRCTVAPGSSSCTATVTYDISNNGWGVYLWDSFSGQSIPVSGSGTVNVLVASDATTYVRLYYFVISHDWNTKKDISGPGTDLNLNTT